jgi:cytochrome c-type biogenesis protein CcmE
MFREGQGVVVEGKLNRDGVFEASTVMVKHSNEYRPPEDGHPRPADTYRSLIRES